MEPVVLGGGEDFFSNLWQAVEGIADVHSPWLSRIARTPTPVRAICPESDSEPENDVPPMELALVAVLNLANLEDIRDIKGIGAKSAAQIIAYRDKGNQFERLDELVTKAGLRRTLVNTLIKNHC